jgi:hypothetical protein
MGSGSLRKSSQTNRGRKPKPRVKTRKETQTKKKKNYKYQDITTRANPFFCFTTIALIALRASERRIQLFF